MLDLFLDLNYFSVTNSKGQSTLRRCQE